MKKLYFRLLLLICGIIQLQTPASAQCPSLAVNSGTITCTTPCATLNALATPPLNATTSYSIGSIAYTPYSFTGGTNASTASGLLTTWDDHFSTAVPLPFSFCYFGTVYNNIVIGTNGNATFNTALADAYDPWPISGALPASGTAQLDATRNAILAPWQDLYPSGSGTIKYATYGVAPCRQFVVSWNNVSLYISAPAGSQSTYQIVLYEATNVIECYIQKRVPYAGWNNGYAVTGMCNNTATLSTFYTAPGENGTTFTAANEGWRYTPTGASSGWTYSWTGPTGSLGTGPTIVVCPTLTTTYTVTATSAACAGVVLTSPTTVTVASLGSPITGTPTMCAGFTTTLADTMAGGVWSSGSPGIATVSSTGVVTGVSGGTAVITYHVGGCDITKVVTVNAAPPMNGPTSACEGNTVTLTDAVIGGTWQSSNTFVATIGLANGVLNALAAGTTMITYTTPPGCVTTRPFTVNPLPGTIAGPSVVCEGSTIILSNSVGGGSWTSSNTSVATITSTGSLSGTGGGVVTITYTLPTGCYKTKLVTVNPLPSAITGPNRVCATFDITLSNTAGGGTWSVNNAAIATINATTGLLHGVMAGVVTVTYTLPTGCLKTTTVTVYALPSAPTTTDLIYCQRTTPLPVPALTAVTSAGGSLNWYSDSTIISSIPTPTPSLVPGVYVWFVSQTVNQCESPNRTRISVTVHAQSTRPSIVPVRPYACQFDTLTLTYNQPAFPGIRYYWTVPNYAEIKGGNRTTPAIVTEFDTSFNHNYVYLMTSDGYHPCDVLDTLDLPVKIAPVADFYAKPDVCVGDTVSVALTYIGASVADYKWDFGPDSSFITKNSNHGGPFKMSWSQKGIHILKLTAFNGLACPSRDFFDTINVHDYPNPKITATKLLNNSSGTICIGDSLELWAQVNSEEYKYHWSPEYMFRETNKYHTYARSVIQDYIKLTVTDPFGCDATDSVFINAQPCCQVSFPTAFTPNGDHLNDVFHPITEGNHPIHSFRVVNRWGQVIFECANEQCGWDGTYNGVPQDMGVYYWFVKYDCDHNTITEKGEVTLVR